MTVTAPQVVSAPIGLAMVALTAITADRMVLPAAAAATVAVLVAVVFRPAATAGVLLVVSAIALGSPAPIAVAVSGFCAASYLVLRHSVTVTVATVVAASGFTVAGMAAATFPLQLPWLPALAPVAAFGCYALASFPFVGRASRNGLR